MFGFLYCKAVQYPIAINTLGRTFSVSSFRALDGLAVTVGTLWTVASRRRPLSSYEFRSRPNPAEVELELELEPERVCLLVCVCVCRERAGHRERTRDGWIDCGPGWLAGWPTGRVAGVGSVARRWSPLGCCSSPSRCGLRPRSNFPLRRRTPSVQLPPLNRFCPATGDDVTVRGCSGEEVGCPQS